MAQTFQCPSCGANQEHDARTPALITCAYCGQSIIVPKELRQERASAQPYYTNALTQKRVISVPPSASMSTTPKPNRRAPQWLRVLVHVGVFAVASGLFSLSYSPQVRALVRPYITAETPWVIRSLWYWTKPGALPLPGTGVDEAALPSLATVMMHFGSSGIGPGQFQNATAVAVDNTGRIFVAEGENGRIQIFTPDGQFISQWRVDHEFLIEQIVADRANGLYLLQGGTITRYDAMTGTRLSSVVYPDLVPFFRDFTLTTDGGLVATRFVGADEIVRYNAQGELVADYKHLLADQLDQVVVNTKVAVDGLDNLYVIAGEFHPALLKFSAEGKFLDKIADDSAGPAAIANFAEVVVDGQGRIIVGSRLGVQIFQANGAYLATIPMGAGVTGVALTPQDELLVLTATQVTKLRLASGA